MTNVPQPFVRRPEQTETDHMIELIRDVIGDHADLSVYEREDLYFLAEQLALHLDHILTQNPELTR